MLDADYLQQTRERFLRIAVLIDGEKTPNLPREARALCQEITGENVVMSFNITRNGWSLYFLKPTRDEVVPGFCGIRRDGRKLTIETNSTPRRTGPIYAIASRWNDALAAEAGTDVVPHLTPKPETVWNHTTRGVAQ